MMTAEQLALLGYAPTMGSPALDQANASATAAGSASGSPNAITAQDLQQFYAQASNPNAGAVDPSMLKPIQQQVDPAMLSALMGSQQSPEEANQVSANQLAMMDPTGGLTSGPSPAPSSAQAPASPAVSVAPTQPVLDANGNPLPLPGNSDANNPQLQGSPDLGQPAASTAPTSAPNRQQPQYSDFDKFMIQTGRAGVDMTAAERLQAHKAYDAYMLKSMELNDPAKKLDLAIKQHQIATFPQTDQNLQAQTAESQTKVIQGELAKQNAMDAANGQISELQSQRDNLQAIANHPALPAMVGAAGQYNPGLTDQQRNLKTYFDQIDGQKLIDGINKIKNESAVPGSPLNFRITQQEVLAVKDSVNRLKRSQSPDDYKAAIASYTSILDRAIAAKQAQVARMPGVNQELLKQFSYSPSTGSSATTAGASTASAPVIKTIPGRGTFQSLGNGQWKQIR